MLLFSPILMLLTSPACMYQQHQVRVTTAVMCTACDNAGSRRECPSNSSVVSVYIPRNTAPYHTDELFPNDTSPIIEEFGATKISSASWGFLLLKGWSVLCLDTARNTMALCAWIMHPRNSARQITKMTAQYHLINRSLTCLSVGIFALHGCPHAIDSLPCCTDGGPEAFDERCHASPWPLECGAAQPLLQRYVCRLVDENCAVQ